ncbi:unnamed protein product [Spodoptera littoralis]|uniref:Uncharacterized protein n=1 Tax=Spodoptera littoralis TaxID=7109 RepID=A0A9P0IFS0_SPOLI|nr:unnamed protein product [Spodoptera littoralis]CAH1646050.1 unnamed protein product [Spodoptera littoralis]
MHCSDVLSFTIYAHCLLEKNVCAPVHDRSLISVTNRSFLFIVVNSFVRVVNVYENIFPPVAALNIFHIKIQFFDGNWIIRSRGDLPVFILVSTHGRHGCVSIGGMS